MFGVVLPSLEKNEVCGMVAPNSFNDMTLKYHTHEKSIEKKRGKLQISLPSKMGLKYKFFLRFFFWQLGKERESIPLGLLYYL